MRFAALLFPLLLTSCVEYIYVRDGGRAARGTPLSASQVKKMLEAGVSEDVVTGKAEVVGVRKLTADDLVALKEAGAGDELLTKLVEEERTEPRIIGAGSTYYRRSYYSPSYYYHYPHYGHHHYHGHYGVHFGYRRHSGSGGARVRFGW